MAERASCPPAKQFLTRARHPVEISTIPHLPLLLLSSSARLPPPATSSSPHYMADRRTSRYWPSGVGQHPQRRNRPLPICSVSQGLCLNCLSSSYIQELTQYMQYSNVLTWREASKLRWSSRCSQRTDSPAMARAGLLGHGTAGR